MGTSGQLAGRSLLAGAAMAGLACLGAAGAGPAMAVAQSAGAGGWGKAVQVPGTAALNKGGVLRPFEVSCVASGSCAAGGYYYDRSEHPQAFVVTRAHGRWRTAIEVPGTAALNTGGSAGTTSVSCAVAGSCAAGGDYSDGPGSSQAFVATEANGRWHPAIEVPGTAALNTGGAAFVMSVSCAAAGSCAAGGRYTDSSGHFQAFVVTEAKGRWHNAIEVPGTAALNTGGFANVTSVSCAAAGSCAAVGFYTGGSHFGHAFVVTEANGQWHQAIEVPGLPALNTGRHAAAESVSCPAAGSCAAVGFYTGGSSSEQAFAVTEANGRWHNAIEVPGLSALNRGGSAFAGTVSCASAGNCAAGGDYTDGSRHRQAFAVTEANGRWNNAIEVPGTAALNKGGAEVSSVTCTGAGNCVAGGSYTDRSHFQHAFLVTEANGRWRTAIEVPGLAALSKGGSSGVNSVSCTAAGGCAAIGGYVASGRDHAFVVSKP